MVINPVAKTCWCKRTEIILLIFLKKLPLACVVLSQGTAGPRSALCPVLLGVMAGMRGDPASQAERHSTVEAHRSSLRACPTVGQWHACVGCSWVQRGEWHSGGPFRGPCAASSKWGLSGKQALKVLNQGSDMQKNQACLKIKQVAFKQNDLK